ncbi:MAG: molybdenum cofactor guanylyltransferase [Gemmatimonadales bacterium]|nr:MAG: molybdenum cofactor guanylyltransferase [Gemmatimonadales bacterium]
MPVGLILAGGRSSRMGRDKAMLRVGGERLLERQARVLREAGVSEVVLSLGSAAGAPSGGEDPTPAGGPTDPAAGAAIPPGLPIVRDAAPDAGPLAGIVAGLEWAAPRPLLVLAVDMPRVEPEFLRRLLREARDPGARDPAAPDIIPGVAPRVRGSDGVERWEPLCAVYPPEALPEARRRLALDDPGERSPTALLDALHAAGLIRACPVTAAEAASLQSWNTPSDLPESDG